MGCNCGKGRGTSPLAAPAMQNGSIEFVVRYSDGSVSEPLPSIDEAIELAGATGGQARSRAKLP